MDVRGRELRRKAQRCPNKPSNKCPHEHAGELAERRNNCDDTDEDYNNNVLGLIREGSGPCCQWPPNGTSV